MIVSFSGIDSAGKTTQIDMLCKFLQDKRIKYIKKWSKARGTPGVVFLKDVLRKDKGMSSTDKAAYRAEIFQNTKKKKALYVACMLDLCWYWGIYYRILNVTNDIVICDRYIWDTYVEMTEKDFKGINIDESILWKLVKLVSPKPKKSFIFVISAEESLERDLRKNAAGVEDIVIKKNKIKCYMKCINNNCWTNVMDGMRPIDELHATVLNELGFGE